VINISRLKPAVSKRILLFVAAGVWTFAGSMLLYKGFKMLDFSSNFYWLILLIALAGGIVFYFGLFSRLAMKHTIRILQLKENKPCLFSFFNRRSYLMMILMITMGITLRKSGLVTPEHLAWLYLVMAVPLILSSLRFYYTGFFYNDFRVVVVPGR